MEKVEGEEEWGKGRRRRTYGNRKGTVKLWEEKKSKKSGILIEDDIIGLERNLALEKFRVLTESNSFSFSFTLSCCLSLSSSLPLSFPLLPSPPFSNKNLQTFNLLKLFWIYFKPQIS